MKKLLLLLFVSVLFACKNDKKSSSEEEQISTSNTIEKELNILEKIAQAHGINYWSKVDVINFSFVVNPGEGEMLRQWSWYPKKNRVLLVKDNEKIAYSRNNIMEEFIQTDKAFINDSFWLLFPFHLVWDDIQHEVIENQESPIKKIESTKLIVKYPDDGGYTPGDRYDVYLDKNHHIIEWAYYPSGQDKPALINTFEDLSNFDGIKINMVHQNPETGFQLNFRDVSIN